MPRRLSAVPNASSENQVRIVGAYEAVLRAWSRREVIEPMGWLEASGDPDVFAEYERETNVLAGLFYDERFGEPVVGWHYWLPS